MNYDWMSWLQILMLTYATVPAKTVHNCIFGNSIKTNLKHSNHCGSVVLAWITTMLDLQYEVTRAVF